MQLVYDVLVILHLLGMATIVAGALAVRLGASESRSLVHVLYGAGTQVVTGLALVGIASAKLASQPPNNAKIAVKLVIAVVVLVLALVLWRRQGKEIRGGLMGLAGLTLVNVGIAVLW
ncbi:hypothetical protein [Amycolatopsis anabasis]|uniref:hypothetical protein n=1 Tax=Amycolatopsis anabasis TaxID=1840409 RepID=UPI00131C277E|nr:hypothetical protein [Amycolatopsis anabasis]